MQGKLLLSGKNRTLHDQRITALWLVLAVTISACIFSAFEVKTELKKVVHVHANKTEMKKVD